MKQMEAIQQIINPKAITRIMRQTKQIIMGQIRLTKRMGVITLTPQTKPMKLMAQMDKMERMKQVETTKQIMVMKQIQQMKRIRPTKRM